jgi:hypothetical protein
MGSNDGNKTEIIAKSYKDNIKYFPKKMVVFLQL